MAEIPSALSLQGCLAQALAPVVARATLGCRYHGWPHATNLGDSLPQLRFSRDRQDIAYLYRPSTAHPSTNHPNTKSGAIPDALTTTLVAQWVDLSQATPQKNVGAGSPDPITLGRGNPDFPNPDSLDPVPLWADWKIYLSAHTTAQALPSGQIVLRPTAPALGAWLWAFTHTCPPPPNPTDSAPIPFPQKQAPLAEVLHLSPLALLQYTHMRCHQLAQRSPLWPLPLSPNFPNPPVDLANGLAALAPSSPSGLQLLRAIIALVDHLALDDLVQPSLTTENPLPPQILNQGFIKGYHLCEAADLWLRDIVGQSGEPATVLLLQGASQGLAHLLQGWLQATAPTQL